MTVPHPDEDPEFWDRCTIDGTVVPGRVTVRCPVKRDIDKKKPKGSDGARLEDRGYMLAEVEIDVEIGGGEQGYKDFADMQELIDQIHPRKKGGARAKQQISSPQTEINRITDIYVYSIDGPKREKNGLLMWKLKATEWTPQPVEVKQADPTQSQGFQPGYDPFNPVPYLPQDSESPGLPAQQPSELENLFAGPGALGL